jgi:hypothetical protein
MGRRPIPVLAFTTTTFRPRDRAVVFIHIGHSDMAGRADGPANLRPFFTDVNPQLGTYAQGAHSPARDRPPATRAASARPVGAWRF